LLDENFPDYYKRLGVNSTLLEDTYYSTRLNITIADILDLKEGSIKAGIVKLEGKK